MSRCYYGTTASSLVDVEDRNRGSMDGQFGTQNDRQSDDDAMG